MVAIANRLGKYTYLYLSTNDMTTFGRASFRRFFKMSCRSVTLTSTHTTTVQYQKLQAQICTSGTILKTDLLVMPIFPILSESWIAFKVLVQTFLAAN